MFYSYTATEDCIVSFTSTSNTPSSSLFIYPKCSGLAGPCLAAAGNDSESPRIINYAVTAGSTYIIVISSSSLAQNIGYNLLIQCESCSNKHTDLFISIMGSTFANLGGTLPEGAATLSYHVAAQLAGSPIPSGAEEYAEALYPNFIIMGLMPQKPYQYWVRSECAPGVFSAWEGPLLFVLPTCPMPQDGYQSVISSTSTQLNWSDPNGANQWEVFASVNGTVPSNGSPINVGNPQYAIANTNINYIVNGLSPQTNYGF